MHKVEICLSRLSLTVCLSVCLRRFVWNPSKGFQRTETKPISHESLEWHVMAASVFRYRQYLRRKCRLQMGYFTVSLFFMRVTSQQYNAHTTSNPVKTKQLYIGPFLGKIRTY